MRGIIRSAALIMYATVCALLCVTIRTTIRPSIRPSIRTTMRAIELIAGVDEAGRGPLAGPVVAAAAVLDVNHPIDGLDDSKKLSPTVRAQLEGAIKRRALYWAIGQASVAEIDALNILGATMLAMRRAVIALGVMPTRALVDGNRKPQLPCAVRTIVGGDALIAEISAASILAKQARDRMMIALSAAHPQYGFDRHKGYPTRAHLDALHRYGVCAHHRRSYAPVRRALGRAK